MGVRITNEDEQMVVVAQMPVTAANAPNAAALFTEQLAGGASIEIEVNENSYLVVRPFVPVPVEADNNNG